MTESQARILASRFLHMQVTHRLPDGMYLAQYHYWNNISRKWIEPCYALLYDDYHGDPSVSWIGLVTANLDMVWRAEVSLVQADIEKHRRFYEHFDAVAVRKKLASTQ